MDLLINIVLLISGLSGALIAVLGKTWDQSKSHPIERVTRLGWIAITFIGISLTFGIIKEFRSREEAHRQATALQEVKDGALRLEGKNELLQQQIAVTLSTLGKQEQIHSIIFGIDAIYAQEAGQRSQGFSTIAELASHTAGRDMSPMRLGVKFTLDYGPLTLTTFGIHIPDQQEQWFVKFLFDGKERTGYYKTKPLPVDLYTIAGSSRFGTLFHTRLGEREIDYFLSSRALLSEIHKRTSYNYRDFDPRFELGTLVLEKFVILPDNATGAGFAQELSAHWPSSDDPSKQITFSDDFYKEWGVVFELNGYNFYNISGNGFPDYDTRKRFSDWPVRPKYRAQSGEIVLAPLAKQWAAFRTHMSPNVQQLLYGDRGK